ncbi:anthranilate synthase component II [Prosthecodimorpha staleyi]|uniref:Aminodeoxychorismate/anthranilate synthase component II n=1 Tax=Prosthecodimorpha staleyi TaxID=2840188 RepID=A0A947D8A2_9HYPH|nr:aminodeoxychorismate/anthranilate synthase component II [Prosthecodimorpha staleyi]MBT9291924.1 aminodeoxychorismate/anthranilate synthase component II [Prosthecodimorpha staleyi]
MILVIDNYDSFVANVARYFRVLGAETRLVRNDRIGLDGIRALAPDAIVISPGPCTPAEAGISNAAIAALSGQIPILGICLGHQCMGAVWGERVTRAKTPMHGRASMIAHDGTGLFAGLPNPLEVGRYHSLVVEIDRPEASPLRITARSEDGEIMGLEHRQHPTWGVQFHPESVLTEGGLVMCANFLRLAADWRAGRPVRSVA